MNNNKSTGVSYLSGFFILVGLTLLGFVVAGLIGAIILVMTNGGSLTAIQNAVKDPANAGTLRVIQVLSVIVSMFLPALIVARILNRRPFELLGYRKQVSAKQVGLVVGIMILSLFVAGALGYLNKMIPVSPSMKLQFDKLETSYAEQVELMLDFTSPVGLLMSLLVMALVPAICEETLFRGGLQNFLQRAGRSIWPGIIIVSIIFSLVHFSFYGFLPRLFLGIVLGLIFTYTRNIWLCMLGHFLNNALAVVTAYIQTRQGKPLQEAMNEDVPYWYVGLLALPILVYVLVQLKKTGNVHEELNPSQDGV